LGLYCVAGCGAVTRSSAMALCGGGDAQRQRHPERGRTRSGGETYAPAVALRDDLLGQVEPQPRALTDPLGRPERFEEMRLLLLRNTRAVVRDFDPDLSVVSEGGKRQHAAVCHGIDGVVDEVRPDLAEF